MSKRNLVVEDQPDNRQIIRDMLAPTDYEIENGEEALTAIGKQPRPRIPLWKGLSAESEEKREPASDIDTAVVVSLKALDLNRPIREADMMRTCRNVRL
jgi:CheY-like chemotaxis protein